MDKESDYNEENFIKKHTQSIEIEKLMLLIEISEKRICKIESKDGNHGTGFFCTLKYLESWETYNVLITNEHILTERDLSPGNIVKFSINNGKNNFEIKIDDKRIVYTSREYDTSIIEIKPEDGIAKDAFFEIDDKIFDENYKEIFEQKPVYLFHYPKGSDMQFTDGVILSINKENWTFAHTCDSSEGSVGGPIINLTTLNVIGMHKGGAKEDQNYNLGIIIKVPIEMFNEKIKEKIDITDINENEELNENERINENEIIYENEIINENEELNENENEINAYENNNNEEKSKENIRELKDDNTNNNVPLGHDDNNKLVYDNGEYYIGEITNNLRQGKGILYYQDGNIKYAGEFVNDKFEGNGNYLMKDGGYYVGHWS